MKNILVFFELSRGFEGINNAFSSAGDQVQHEIIKEFKKAFCYKITCVSHDPNPIWPKGPLFVSGSKNTEVIRPSYINLVLLKQLTIFFHYLWFSFSIKPDLILKYNLNIFDAVALIITRLVSKIKVCVFIQDVLIKNGIRHVLTRFLNSRAIKLSKFFDVLVPITLNIANDFKLPTSKTIVFSGGMTRQTRQILNATHLPGREKLQDRAIFAGALESYNGVDWLVRSWIDEKVSLPLFVFGNGNLKYLIEAEQKRSGGKVIYMGFRDETTVSEYIATSKINICLRFSKGIKEEYFFPSKFINMCAAPGLLVCNKFMNIPAPIFNKCCIVDASISDCINKIEKLSELQIVDYHQQRVQWLNTHANWSEVVGKIIVKLGWAL